MDWRPIDSAPKDGTAIMVYGTQNTLAWDSKENDPRHAVMRWNPNPGGHGHWEAYYSGRDPVDEPTHWMPLPESPK